MTHSVRIFILISFSLLSHQSTFGQQTDREGIVQVDRIEPPNWWQGMKWNRVQILVTGKNLKEVTVTSAEPESVKVVSQHCENSQYLFVALEVSPTAPPKNYALNFSRKTVSIDYPWEIKQRVAGKKHLGFDQSDVVYLITPDRFANGNPDNDEVENQFDEYDPSKAGKRHGGDLIGITRKLDYLADLGVTAIWLNPILENRGLNSYHGYKTTDHYRIDPRFGSNDDYRALIDAAHKRKIKVIFDHVSNHIGVKHPWIKQLPTNTWLNGSVENHLLDKHYLHSVADIHADEETRRELKTFWFVDSMPDLNQRDPYVSNYLIQNTIWWIEYAGIDGIREDTWPYADDTFLANWVDAIMTEYPNFNIVGEIWSLQSAHIARYQKGTPLPRQTPANLPAVMDFPLSQALRNFAAGKGKLRDVHEAYSQDFLYGDPNQLMVFVDNHDMSRIFYLADDSDKKAKLAMEIMLLGRGIPQVLYGTEIGMVGGESHVELRADFPGGFPNLRPNEPSAFTSDGRTQDQTSTHHWLRSLLKLRGQNKAFTHGKMIHFAPTWNRDVYRFIRACDDQKVLVIANGESQSLDIELGDIRRHLSRDGLIDLLTGEKFRPDQPIPVNGTSIRVLEIN